MNFRLYLESSPGYRNSYITTYYSSSIYLHRWDKNYFCFLYIGTAHWTAPEIIQGSIFGRKADIW